MATEARFPHARARAGMYESFYLRAVSPEEPVAIWIRHTVHKAPGRAPRGSVWCTVFDARRGRPFMHKLSTDELRVPAGGWIAVGDSAMGAGHADGSCGDARWSLRFAADQAELRHLSPAWLYRAPLPRTKLTSPAPAASFDGVLELAGRERDRAARLAGDGRAQLGLRARRALDLVARSRVRRGAQRVAGRRARAPEARRADDPVGRPAARCSWMARATASAGSARAGRASTRTRAAAR